MKGFHLPDAVFLAFLLIHLVCAPRALGRAPEEAEFYASTRLGTDIGHWVANLKNRPTSIAVFAVHAAEPFDGEFTRLIETQTIQELRQEGITRATPCGECRTPQISVEGSDIVIAKGAPDTEAIKRVGRRLSVDSLLVTEVYRTKLSMLASATLYSSTSGEVLGAEKFQTPALNLSDASVQFLVTVGPGKPFFSTTSASEGFTTAVNVILLEEVGFGKGGLTVGGILAPGATLIYLNPTLSLGGRFGSSNMAYAFMLGGGYGFQGSIRGITARGAFEVIFGSWALAGVEVTQFFGARSGLNPLKTYVGFHVGFSLGR